MSKLVVRPDDIHDKLDILFVEAGDPTYCLEGHATSEVVSSR